MADPYRAPRPDAAPPRDAMRTVLIVVGILAALAAAAALVAGSREVRSPTVQAATVPAVAVDASSGGIDAAASGKPSRRCADHRAANEAFLADYERARPGCKLPSHVRDALACCWEGAHATWAMHVESMSVTPTSPDDACQAASLHVALVHIAETGEVASARPSTTVPDVVQPAADQPNITVHSLDWLEMSLRFFDYDGDGDAEVITHGTHHSGMAGYDREWGELWTFKDGAVGRYKPATNVRFVTTDDVDHDGRPDLMTRGPYDDVLEGRCYDETRHVVEPIFPAHSLPDGTFSQTDGAARELVAAQCKTPKDDAMRLLCARLRGEKPALPQDAGCDGLDELVRVEPPFRL